jgi:soluble lytic murein transglycosylase
LVFGGAPLLAVLLALLGFSLLVSGQASSPDPAQVLAAAAVQTRQDSFAAALITLRPALSAANTVMQGRARLLAGYCEFKLKRYDDARADLRRASMLYPQVSFHGLFYGAMSYQEQGKFPEAAELWEKLISSNPPGDLTGRALLELLRSCRRGDDADHAGKTMARLQALAVKDPTWQREMDYSLGWIKLKKGEKKDARTIFKNLWILHPESFWADQAEKYLIGPDSAALVLPGESSIVSESDRLDRVRNLIASNCPSQALTELAPIIAGAEKNASTSRLASLYRLRAGAYDRKRDLNNAISDYQRTQDLLGAEDVELSYLIGSCLRRQGRHAEALEKYRSIWTRHPGNEFATRALFYAARMQKMDNDWEGAKQTYQKLISDYPSSSLKPEALFQEAWLYYLTRDFAKARDYLVETPSKRGDDQFNCRLLYWKSDVLRRLGEREAAQKVEAEILKEYWDSGYAFYLVMVKGVKWPYGPGGKPLPPPAADPPLEYRIARELYGLGLDRDADGQLESLSQAGRLPEDLAFAVAAMHRDTGNFWASQRIASRNLKTRLSTQPPGEAEAWHLAYPRAYKDIVVKYAAENGLDPLLLWAVMRAESTYRPDIRSSAGAIGLMQVMPMTGKIIARALGEKDYRAASLYDPGQNLKYGAFYLGNRVKEFSDGAADPESRLKTLTRALAAYNAGPERAKQWGARADQLGLSPEAFVEEIPLKETNDYVKKILGFYLIYLTAYPPEPKTDPLLPSDSN